MLSISLVLYRPDMEGEVNPLLTELRMTHGLEHIYTRDNSIEENIGYGRGHNIALRQTKARYHLVLNSDILVKHEDIERMVAYMEKNPDIVLLSPKVTYPNGEIQRLCKLLPTPLDVFGRRFLPKRWMKARNERYTLQRNSRDEFVSNSYEHEMDVPYLSGCFMLLRTDAARKIGYFDERYFMYPEDIDLTRRLHKIGRTVYWPEVTIVHNHAQASYKSKKMLWIHITNLSRYFCKWGWLFDKERTLFNTEAKKQLD